MNGEIRLVAFRVERRSVAAAVFVGTHLEYADVRQLSSDHQKAESSAGGFVNWIVESFDFTSAALEKFENGEEMLRGQLNRAIEESLRSAGVSVYPVGRAELLAAFGQPPLPNRKAVREVIVSIWPILQANRVSGTKLDAVALGLYFQTERLFQP